MSLNSVRDAYVECRTWGHQWESFQPLQRERGYGTQISLRCTRCRKERFDWIDSTGALNARQYNDPPDYKMARGETPNIAQLRLEMIRRIGKRAAGRALPARSSSGQGESSALRAV